MTIGKRHIVKILAASRPDQITYLNAAGDSTKDVQEEAKRAIHGWNYTVEQFALAMKVDANEFRRKCEDAERKLRVGT